MGPRQGIVVEERPLKVDEEEEEVIEEERKEAEGISFLFILVLFVLGPLLFGFLFQDSYFLSAPSSLSSSSSSVSSSSPYAAVRWSVVLSREDGEAKGHGAEFDSDSSEYYLSRMDAITSSLGLVNFGRVGDSPRVFIVAVPRGQWTESGMEQAEKAYREIKQVLEEHAEVEMVHEQRPLRRFRRRGGGEEERRGLAGVGATWNDGHDVRYRRAGMPMHVSANAVEENDFQSSMRSIGSSNAEEEGKGKEIAEKDNYDGGYRQKKADFFFSSSAFLSSSYPFVNDPLYSRQWHLQFSLNTNSKKDKDKKGSSPQTRRHIDVLDVWRLLNITGRGVVISFIDDGVDHTHPDIKHAWSPEAGLDLNASPFDHDPMPRFNEKNRLDEVLNHHGTRCAGEIVAAANNSVCGIGVAPGSRVSGVRMIDGDVYDASEAAALGYQLDWVDIINASWGPSDEGDAVDGPGPLARAQLKRTGQEGRNGYGTLMVFASGNGGWSHDNCNFDGYANDIHTITVGGIGADDRSASYSEICASQLAVTYSSQPANHKHKATPPAKGNPGLEAWMLKGITTTDWNGKCTSQHSGTSAGAPLVAGILALVLEARPCLTWRDVQHIMVIGAVKVDVEHELWKRNGAGLWCNEMYGFGKLEGMRLVRIAQRWSLIGKQTSWTGGRKTVMKRIVANDAEGITVDMDVRDKGLQLSQGLGLKYLEHVILNVDLEHPVRGTLSIALTSPSGTVAHLATRRERDLSTDGLNFWNFSTVFMWSEQPFGVWKVNVKCETFQGTNDIADGTVKYVQLYLFGHSEHNWERSDFEDVKLDKMPTQKCSKTPTKHVRYYKKPKSAPVVYYILALVSLLGFVGVIWTLIYLFVYRGRVLPPTGGGGSVLCWRKSLLGGRSSPLGGSSSIGGDTGSGKGSRHGSDLEINYEQLPTVET
eukprot:Nk52_evm15s32 gene=Nk52_evmTU15s32